MKKGAFVPILTPTNSRRAQTIHFEMPRVEEELPSQWLKFPPVPKLVRQVQAAIVKLTRANSLKCCPACGTRHRRHHKTTGPLTIDLANPGFPLIHPRVSDIRPKTVSSKWWNYLPVVYWFATTPSYNGRHNWFLVEPSVGCPNRNCELYSDFTLQVKGRCGLRTYPEGRVLIERIKAFLYPDEYTFITVKPQKD